MPLALTTQTDQSVFLLAQFDVLGEKHLESDEITFQSSIPFSVTHDEIFKKMQDNFTIFCIRRQLLVKNKVFVFLRLLLTSFFG